MKIMITGASGFVGSATMELLEKKNNMEILGNPWPFKIFNYDIMDGYDVCDKEQFMETCLEWQPDRVLHLAAIARIVEADAFPKRAFETNVMGTKNVAEVCSKLHIPLVYASTGSVYTPIKEDPPITEDFKARGNNVYGCTKYMGELYVKEVYPHIILRYAHLYGKEKRYYGLVGKSLERIERGLKPVLFGGKQSNDMTSIYDVAQANYLALTTDWHNWNQTYNIGSGEEITTEEAQSILCDMVGWSQGIEKTESRHMDAMRFVYDISKARRMLGYEPKYSFKEGLEKMLKDIGVL